MLTTSFKSLNTLLLKLLKQNVYFGIDILYYLGLYMRILYNQLILLQNLKEARRELQLKETRIMKLVAENQDLKDCMQKGNKVCTMSYSL